MAKINEKSSPGMWKLHILWLKSALLAVDYGFTS